MEHRTLGSVLDDLAARFGAATSVGGSGCTSPSIWRVWHVEVVVVRRGGSGELAPEQRIGDIRRLSAVRCRASAPVGG